MGKKVIKLTESDLKKIVEKTLKEQDMRSVGQKLKDGTINRVGSKLTPWNRNPEKNKYKTRANNVRMYKYLKYLEKMYMKLNSNLKPLINIQDVVNKLAELEKNGLTK